MPFSNLQYLYDNLPGRVRRDDAALFWKRFLTPVGAELDGFDLDLATFYQKIDPATAPSEFIDWWLYALFGWGWFPSWFTLDRRRAFYAAITRHYAERGTLKGIKRFLEAFGLRCIVEGEPRFYGEETLGENVWTTPGPMVIIVRLFPEAPAVIEDLSFYGEASFGDDYGASPGQSIQLPDIDALLRFSWPLAQHIFIEELPLRPPAPWGVPPPDSPLYGEGEYGTAIPG